MPLIRRYEGELVQGESSERKFMPFLMRGRNESIVLYEQAVDVTAVLAYLERVNAGLPEKKVTFFNVLLCAMVRAMALRPKMNRFVVGRRIYQRKWIDVSFAVKKKFHDDANMSVVKVRFDKEDTLSTVAEKVQRSISRGRDSAETGSEKLMSFFIRMPRPIIHFVMWFLRTLDYFNLLPGSMIETDETYCSMFLANLGSVGLEAPYHHLYEWGTVPLFGVIGKVAKEPTVDEAGQVVARDIVRVKWSYDERIADGFYCARSLDLFRDFMRDPQSLERPPQSPKPELRAASPEPEQAAAP
jgi:hypothetical protein